MPLKAMITWEEERNPSGPLPLQTFVPVCLFWMLPRVVDQPGVCHPPVFPAIVIHVRISQEDPNSFLSTNGTEWPPSDAKEYLALGPLASTEAPTPGGAGTASQTIVHRSCDNIHSAVTLSSRLEVCSRDGALKAFPFEPVPWYR